MQRTVVTRAPCWHSQRDAREDARPSGLGSGQVRAECRGGRRPPNLSHVPRTPESAWFCSAPQHCRINVLGREQVVIQRGLFFPWKAASDTVSCFSDLFREIEGFAVLQTRGISESHLPPSLLYEISVFPCFLTASLQFTTPNTPQIQPAASLHIGTSLSRVALA